MISCFYFSSSTLRWCAKFNNFKFKKTYPSALEGSAKLCEKQHVYKSSKYIVKHGRLMK